MDKDIEAKISKMLAEKYESVFMDDYISENMSGTHDLVEYTFTQKEDYEVDKYYAFNIHRHEKSITTDAYGVDIGAWDDYEMSDDFLIFINKDTLKIAENIPELEVIELDYINKLRPKLFERSGLEKFRDTFRELELAIYDKEMRLDLDDTLTEEQKVSIKKELADLEVEMGKHPISQWGANYEANKPKLVKEYIEDRYKELRKQKGKGEER